MKSYNSEVPTISQHSRRSI